MRAARADTITGGGPSPRRSALVIEDVLSAGSSVMNIGLTGASGSMLSSSPCGLRGLFRGVFVRVYPALSDRLLVFAANPWSPVALPHLQQEATKKSESKRVGKEVRKVGPQEMSTENNADYYDYVKFASDLCTQPVYFSLRSNFSPRRSQNQLLLGWQPFF